MSNRYILNEKEPVPEPDLMKWAAWFEKAKRQVDHTEINDNVRVSTVFLGLDHNFGPTGRPLLFETMILGGEHDQYQERYCTWDEAETGHKVAVALVEGK